MQKHTKSKSNIKHGTIELVLLLLLQKEPKYGYQLSQELFEFSDGKYVSDFISTYTKWLSKL